MSTTTQGGVATVRRFYDLVGAGDLEAATALMHDDLVIREPPGLPFGGEYHGPAGFLDLMGRINEQFEPSLAAPVEYLDASDPVVIRLVGRFASRASGESVEMDIVELFHVRDDQIAVLDVYYKDPGAIVALSSRAA
jgi:ketosteroid isomerase-like protein